MSGRAGRVPGPAPETTALCPEQEQTGSSSRGLCSPRAWGCDAGLGAREPLTGPGAWAAAGTSPPGAAGRPRGSGSCGGDRCALEQARAPAAPAAAPAPGRTLAREHGADGAGGGRHRAGAGETEGHAADRPYMPGPILPPPNVSQGLRPPCRTVTGIFRAPLRAGSRQESWGRGRGNPARSHPGWEGRGRRTGQGLAQGQGVLVETGPRSSLGTC